MVKLTVTTLMTSVMESGIAVSMAGMNYIVVRSQSTLSVLQKIALFVIPNIRNILSVNSFVFHLKFNHHFRKLQHFV